MTSERHRPLLGKCAVSNHLECKICLTSYRLFYVENTEDFFYRPRPHQAAEPATDVLREKRHNRFHSFLLRKNLAMPALANGSAEVQERSPGMAKGKN